MAPELQPPVGHPGSFLCQSFQPSSSRSLIQRHLLLLQHLLLFRLNIKASNK
ncbi:hypothetical protein I79_003487 [Cricetulus griseus]|uniref:Uncharacterized protein n=1 Tax=Cricetulus griseus TaxID=10029 RepID=G3H039_CRIGR|nr:hypothetical protein I79_003487 [Cricetulus griseus]